MGLNNYENLELVIAAMFRNRHANFPTIHALTEIETETKTKWLLTIINKEIRS